MTEPTDDRDARSLDAHLLSDLWFFRAVARLGSVTLAAQRLGVTQGAVSQRILRLEARLRAALFVRQKGKMLLTKSGATLFEVMTKVALDLNESLSQIDRLERTAIVLSCIPSLATEWLVPHLDDFYQKYPGIEIFIRAELAASTPERIEAEGIDIIIDYYHSSATELHELATIREYLLPVCSPNYRRMLEGHRTARK